MKFLTLLMASAFTFIALSQKSDILKEDGGSLTPFFIPSDDLQESTLDERYGSLTRSEGFVVEGVTKMGSVFTRKLHRSGKVIFSSEAGKYLNELKSKLLQDYPKVDELINIYITENPTLNAFATVNNNIYINLGLIARVENEAQLAFIMSHEIMHIVNAHIINQSLDINEKASTYNKGNLAIEDDFLQLYRHELSRSSETEADLDGFTLFLKQDYDPAEGRKALELLRRANDFTIDIPADPKLFFMSDSAQYAKLNMDYLMRDIKEDEEKDEDVNDDEENEGSHDHDDKKYRTHPLIEERLESIEELYKDLDSSKYNGVQYVVSEKKFQELHREANASINRIYGEDLDFAALFLNSSARLNFYADSSDENLNYLGYSLQGLMIDKVKKYKIGEARSTNAADSLFSYFYTNSTVDEFSKWTFETIDQLNGQFDFAKLKSYHQSIVQTIVNQKPDSAEYIFGDQLSNIDQTVVKNINGLDIDKLSFEVSPFADMTRRQVNYFNDTQIDNYLREGKIAIVNMNNIKVRKSQPLTYNYIVDEAKCEELDSRSDAVWQHIEEDYDGQVISLVPNPIDYNGDEYEMYDKLNQWIGERLYFNNYYYVSVHDEDIRNIVQNEDIRYALSTLNIEIKSGSMKGFIIAYFSPFVTPHYLPQLVMNFFAGSTRKYQLTLVFDVDTGALTFWDTRTYLEPNTTAQFYTVYNDVFQSLIQNKKK